MLNANSLRRLGRSITGLAALLLLNAIPFAPDAQAASNGTLVVYTQEGADVAAARQTLTDSGCTILKEIPFSSGNFTIFHVKPNSGNVNAVVSMFAGRIDPNIASAEATIQSKCSGFFSWPPRPTCTPNDPDYPSQYALTNMNWNDARCFMRLLGIGQRAYPRFTILDTGCNSIPTGDEMTNIQQFNFVGGLNGVPECNIDSGIHGTAVAGVASVRTNNATFLSGVASHNLPSRVTSCRCSNDGSTVQTIDVLQAMTWCVDNQSLRGGPGIINISLNSIGLPSYNASPVFQEIAKQARAKGDLFVNSSGNDGFVDPSPELNMRRVMAFDEDNNVASFSNTGPFKAGAPGVLVAAMDSPTSVAFGSGTSFAAPNWGGVAALIMSLNPRMTAPRADQIVYQTADTTSQGNKLPNVKRAVIASLIWGWW